MVNKIAKRKQAVVMNMRKVMSDVDNEFSNTEQMSEVRLRALSTKLDAYSAQLEEYGNTVLEEITDDAAYDAELEAHSVLQDEVLEYVAQLKAVLDTMHSQQNQVTVGPAGVQSSTPPGTANQSSSAGTSDRYTVKLPTLQITYYNGDSMKWFEFWDSFKGSIHDRTDLSGVEKFKYLLSYLKGDAKRFLAGYPLSNESYTTAVDALGQRFGDKEKIIQSHLSEFLALPLAGREVHELRKTYDDCERHIRSLVALDLQEDQFGRIFTPIMLSKFPYYLQIDLNRGKGESAWTLEKLRSLLSTEIGARESGLKGFGQPTSYKSNDSSNIGGMYRSQQKSPQQRTAGAFQINTERERKCIFCKGKHFHDECPVTPDVASRRALLRENCFKCLSRRHMSNNCDSERVCYHCKQYGHHRSLCPQAFPAGQAKEFRKNSPPQRTKPQFNVSAETVEESETEQTCNLSSTESATMFSHGSKGQLGYLHTALADVSGAKRSRVRLLLDNGSTVTFITDKLATQIGAKIVGHESMSIAGFGSQAPQVRQCKVYEFKLFLHDRSSLTIQAHGTQCISCPILRYAHDLKANPILSQVKLADTVCTKDEKAELNLLIGGDMYYDIVTGGQVKCENGLILLNTKLGYVVAGKANKTNSKSSQNSQCMFTHGNPVQIEDDLQKLWRLEDIGIKEKPQTTDDEVAVAQFNESVQFDESEKRYMIRWPWNENEKELTDNFRKAKGRLVSLLKRLRKQPAVLETYTDTITKQIERGMVEIAPHIPEGKVHYLPHHEVLEPQRESTKLRVVYDGSCKPEKHEVSLNECLRRGPVILEDLCGLLIRFRMKKVAFVADIEKAFLQIGLQRDQRDVTRFLWVKDPQKLVTDDNIMHFRFARVCFGMISSSFLLGACIQHLCTQADTPIAKLISQHMYVDNLIMGCNTRIEAQQIYSEARELFSSVSMNLRQFYSNDSEFIASIPEAHRGAFKDSNKVLGLNWKMSADVLSCPSAQPKPSTVITKRRILQIVAQAYDPCGFFAAVTVRGKILLQQLWRDKVSWDEPLPVELRRQAETVLADIQCIPKVKIPRCIAVTLNDASSTADVQYQLHAFADASAQAFSVAIYLRQQVNDTVKVDLIFGKSRVAPLKKQTIPKLELLAATLTSRLSKHIGGQLNLRSAEYFAWSDSQCTLHWILGKPVTTVFVRNRVEEIRKNTKLTWRYVPTETNPADIPSRGASLADIENSKIWWHGPEWLQKDKSYWPKNINLPHQAIEQQENDSTSKPIALIVTTDDTTAQFKVARYSKLTKAIGVMAQVLRAVDLFRKRSVVNEQKYRELAEIQLIREAQTRHKQQCNYSSTVKQLRVFQDVDRISRCESRVQHPEQVDPILLPKKDELTNLFIEHYHIQLQHAGVSHVLAEIRYRFWIPQARQAIKHVISKCSKCRRRKGPAYQIPVKPPLPQFRTQVSKPFECTGLDYLGPLYIRSIEENSQKVWICIMTCAVTRAIHLEVVENMSTEQFLLSLRRFMSFYGSPTLIVSDQAKQFHMGNTVLRRLVTEQEDVQEFIKQKATQWKFVVEMAPWMGGFYERMVAIVKNSLKAAIHMSKLTLTELQTVVYETCAVVNTRPLTYIEDEVGFYSITPSHLLMRHCSTYAKISATEAEEYFQKPRSTDNLIVAWKRLQCILEKFWITWRKQYLTTLQNSWFHPQKNVAQQIPCVGDIVLIQDSKQPRSVWQLARIQQVIMSADGHIRAAILILPDRKTLRRPIKLLHPLEMSVESLPENTADSNPQTQSANGSLAERDSRPQRKAAIAARQQIARSIQEEESWE